MFLFWIISKTKIFRMKSLAERVDDCLGKIQDFPQEGVLFRDIGPLLANPELLRETTDFFVSELQNKDVVIDYIVGLESRGFLSGILLAQSLNKPFVMIRKKNKLPGEKFSVSYGLEYGTDVFELQKDLIRPGSSVVLVDDLIATGGSAAAACELVELASSHVSCALFLIELLDSSSRRQGKDWLMTQRDVHVISLVVV